MKKKILSVMLMAAMLLSMTGCGGKNAYEKTNEYGLNKDYEQYIDIDSMVSSVVSSVVSSAVEDIITLAIPETEDFTITTEEPPKEIPKAKRCMLFNNGFFSFSDTGSPTEWPKEGYVYDMVNKVIYEISPKNNERPGGMCGKMLIVYPGIQLLNLETDETYDVTTMYDTSFSENDDSIYDYTYVPVYSLKESFDGNTYSFGVIDDNGEWVLPLSSEYEVCNYELSKYMCDYVFGSVIRFEHTTSFREPDIYYDFKNNKILNAEDFGFDSILRCKGDYILLGNQADGESYYTNISKYNVQTGELSVIDENNIYWNDDSYFNKDFYQGIAIKNEARTEYLILDNEFNKIEFDLSQSQYNEMRVYDATDKYVLFSAKNADGIEYTILLDRAGNRVVEPIKERYTDGYISGEYVVLLGVNDTEDCIVNINTGEVKTYKNKKKYSIERFDPVSAMLLIEAKDFYYLATPDDPDTLINPFEFVNN